MRRRLAAALLSIVAAQAVAQAATTPVVRAKVEPRVTAVGEPLNLTITVLVPTWFPSAPVYPSFELANAVTRLPPDSSYPTSERVGSETWSGIVRTYQVYPLVGATYRLTGQTMRVTYAEPGSIQGVAVDVDVPEIEFRGEVPPGAAGLDPYLAGRKLTLTREVEGNLDGVEVGDAVVLRTVAELDGLPSIFLPSLIGQLELDGASVYSGEPVVEDDGVSRRTESVTLVFESGGELTVPGSTLEWWNTETEAVETASVPPLSISVAGPLPVSDDEAPQPAADWRWLWLTLLAVALILVVLLQAQGFRRLRECRRARGERRRRSEDYAFEQLRRALRSGDLRRSHHALVRWRERCPPDIGLEPDSELSRQTEALGRTLYSDAAQPVDLARLERLLVEARRTSRRRLARCRELALPPMNP